MGSLTPLESRLASVRRIGLDSSIFIYYAEAHERFGPLARQVFKMAESGGRIICASTLVLTEVLTGYRRTGDFASEDMFWNMVRALGWLLSLEPLITDIADRAASFRASYTLQTPDAIHLATSLMTRAEVYITNDRKLKMIKEIPIVVLSDFVQHEF